MKNSTLSSVPHQTSTSFEWIGAVLFLSDSSYFNLPKISRWAKVFGGLTVASENECPENLPPTVKWYNYDKEQVRADIWNLLLGQPDHEWVLFLEDDESLRLSSLPDKNSINAERWAPAFIKRELESGATKQYYHIRLVRAEHGNGQEVFDGRALPDSTRFIRANEIELINHPIIIERESHPMVHVDIEEELSVASYSPKLYLVQGERYFNDRQYVHAAAQYRQLLKEEKLLPFDRLGAVNGLASCMAEQHKWSKALMLAQESLKADSLQSLPYLIQFKINELRKNWQQALDVLRQYYERFSLHSNANFDKVIDEEKTLVNLANIALRAGKRKEAAGYFEKLFVFKRGTVDRSLLRKVLLLSIELKDFERSVHIFERIYNNKLPTDLNREEQKDLDDIMSMFMKNEWYEYVSKVYTKLHNAHPENRTYKRKLIVTLSKTNRLDKAKRMLANIV